MNGVIAISSFVNAQDASEVATPHEKNHLIFLQVGIAGLFIIIGFSSAKMAQVPPVKEQAVKIKADPSEDESIVSEFPSSPATPQKSTPVSTPEKQATSSEYGLVATPGGRRSARIASKSAQKKK